MKYVTKFAEIEALDGVVVVDFWAEWCGPCKMLAPTYEAVAEKLASVATFCKANVDEGRDLAMEYGVSAIPTVVVLKDGGEVARKVGLITAEALEELVKSAL